MLDPKKTSKNVQQFKAKVLNLNLNLITHPSLSSQCQWDQIVSHVKSNKLNLSHSKTPSTQDSDSIDWCKHKLMSKNAQIQSSLVRLLDTFKSYFNKQIWNLQVLSLLEARESIEAQLQARPFRFQVNQNHLLQKLTSTIADFNANPIYKDIDSKAYCNCCNQIAAPGLNSRNFFDFFSLQNGVDSLANYDLGYRMLFAFTQTLIWTALIGSIPIGIFFIVHFSINGFDLNRTYSMAFLVARFWCAFAGVILMWSLYKVLKYRNLGYLKNSGKPILKDFMLVVDGFNYDLMAQDFPNVSYESAVLSTLAKQYPQISQLRVEAVVVPYNMDHYRENKGKIECILAESSELLRQQIMHSKQNETQEIIEQRNQKLIRNSREYYQCLDMITKEKNTNAYKKDEIQQTYAIVVFKNTDMRNTFSKAIQNNKTDRKLSILQTIPSDSQSSLLIPFLSFFFLFILACFFIWLVYHLNNTQLIQKLILSYPGMTYQNDSFSVHFHNGTTDTFDIPLNQQDQPFDYPLTSRVPNNLPQYETALDHLDHIPATFGKVGDPYLLDTYYPLGRYKVKDPFLINLHDIPWVQNYFYGTNQAWKYIEHDHYQQKYKITYPEYAKQVRIKHIPGQYYGIRYDDPQSHEETFKYLYDLATDNPQYGEALDFDNLDPVPVSSNSSSNSTTTSNTTNGNSTSTNSTSTNSTSTNSTSTNSTSNNATNTTSSNSTTSNTTTNNGSASTSSTGTTTTNNTNNATTSNITSNLTENDNTVSNKARHYYCTPTDQQIEEKRLQKIRDCWNKKYTQCGQNEWTNDPDFFKAWHLSNNRHHLQKNPRHLLAKSKNSQQISINIRIFFLTTLVIITTTLLLTISNKLYTRYKGINFKKTGTNFDVIFMSICCLLNLAAVSYLSAYLVRLLNLQNHVIMRIDNMFALLMCFNVISHFVYHLIFNVLRSQIYCLRPIDVYCTNLEVQRSREIQKAKSASDWQQLPKIFSQNQINQKHELNQLQMQFFYAYDVSTVAAGIFFIHYSPVCIMLALAGILIRFYTEQFLLRTLYNKPIEYNNQQMHEKILSSFEYFFILYPIGGLCSIFILEDHTRIYIHNWLPLAIFTGIFLLELIASNKLSAVYKYLAQYDHEEKVAQYSHKLLSTDEKRELYGDQLDFIEFNEQKTTKIGLEKNIKTY